MLLDDLGMICGGHSNHEWGQNAKQIDSICEQIIPPAFEEIVFEISQESQ